MYILLKFDIHQFLTSYFNIIQYILHKYPAKMFYSVNNKNMK